MTLALGPVYAAAAIAAHVIAARLPVRTTSVLRFVGVSVPLGVGLTWTLADRLRLGDSPAWAALLAYCLLGELYLFLFTMVAGSVSASLLRRLSKRPCQRTDLEWLYGSDRMVAQRFQRLLVGGFLRAEGGHYVLTRHGRWAIRLFAALRRFFRNSPPSTKFMILED